MQATNAYAFKEWAVVCEALAAGRQSLILRKGGIHEGRGGFRVEHGEFWLFPTRFHQQPDEILPEARPLLERALSQAPPAGTIRIDSYAVVEQVVRIEEESRLPALAGLHVWSERTVGARFAYHTPGLFALLVRIFRRPVPWDLPDSPHLAGCRSWVEFPRPLPTDGLEPVLADADHRQRMRAIRAAIEPGRLA